MSSQTFPDDQPTGRRAPGALWIDEIRQARLDQLDPARGVGLSARQLQSLSAYPYRDPAAIVAIMLMQAETVIGHLWLVPGRVRIGSETFPIGWMSYWEIRGAHRTPGMGAALLGAAIRANANLGNIYMTSEALRSLRAAGFESLRMWRHVAVLRWRPVLAEQFGHALGLIGSAPIDATTAAIRFGLKLRQVGTNFALHERHLLPADFDRLDVMCRPRGAFVRDRHEIEWASSHGWTDKGTRVLRYYELLLRDQAVAYAIVRRDTVGSIRRAVLFRWGIVPGVKGAARALVGLLTAALDDGTCDVFEVYSADGEVSAAARDNALFRRGHLDLACRLGAAARRAMEAGGLTLAGLRPTMSEGDVLLI